MTQIDLGVSTATTTANLLQYWRDCLIDDAMSGITFERVRQSPTIDFQSITKGRLGAQTTDRIRALASSGEKPTTERSDTIEIAVGLGRISAKYQNGARRSHVDAVVPLWIPALLCDGGILRPQEQRHPFITRTVLEPSPTSIAVGTLDDADAYYETHVPEQRWSENWAACIQWALELWSSVVGSDFSTYASEDFHFERTAYVLPNEVAIDVTKLVEVLDLARERAEQGGGLAILQSVVRSQASTAHDTASGVRHGGHYGPHPLTDDQRVALEHVLRTPHGALQAVNGPPGTGKTTLLRSVIASAMVEAIASTQDLFSVEPPIIVVTSTNNNAVTNVLNSFADVEDQTPFGKRWIDDVGGYGAFLAGKDAAKRAERSNINYPTLLFQNGGTIRGVFDGIEVTAAIATFLKNYLDATGKSAEDLESAVSDLHAKTLSLRAKAAYVAQQLEEYRRIADPSESAARSTLGERFIQTLEPLREKRVAAERELSVIREECSRQRQRIELGLDALQPIWWEAIFGFLDPVRRHRYRRFEKAYGVGTPPYTNDLSAIEDGMRSRRSAFDISESQAAAVHTGAAQAYSIAERECERERDQFETSCRRWHDVVRQLEADLRTSLDPADWGAVQRALDIAYRTDAFRVAMRFWEGRWLLQMRSEKDDIWRRNSATRVRHRHRCIAKLHPFAAVTLHSLPWRFNYFISGTAPGRELEDGHAEPLFEGIDLLIIDESGQVAPHIGAIGLALAKKAMIVGDVYQLEPIVSLDEPLSLANARNRISARPDVADDLGRRGVLVHDNGPSLMHLAQGATAYTLSNASVPGSFLRTHYRCVPEIIRYCDELIYGGLIPKRQSLENPLFPAMGYAHVRGTSAKSGSSRVNETEARLIANFAAKNKDRILDHYVSDPAIAGITTTEALSRLLAIVTPYAAQANEIRRQLRGVLPNDAPITVGTAFAMQGAEARIILYSNVLSPRDPVGFVNRKKNLLNVAVSRAKDHFLVFGDISTIATQPKGSALRLLSEHLLRRDENALGEVPVSFYGEGADVVHVMEHERHRDIFQYACEHASKWLLVVSPFLGQTALAEEIVSPIAQAVERGVVVDIISDSKFAKNPALADPLRAAGAHFQLVDQIHAKTLAMDEALLYEGSYNWLSAVAEGEYHRMESGWLVRGPAASRAIASVRAYFDF